jgi:hypothetical protein
VKLLGLALVIALAGAAGCDDEWRPPDFAVPIDMQVPADLARPGDLTPPLDAFVCTGGPPPDAFVPSTDAGSFCVGTSLAGTCAQAFFERIYDCFAPAGCCAGQVYGVKHGAHIDYEWASGAHSTDQRVSSPNDGINYPGKSWGMCDECGRVEFGGGAGGNDLWTLPDGTTMTINPATGDVTCPDSSQANIGPGYEQCPEVTLRLDVNHKGSVVYDCPEAYPGPNTCP